MVKKRVFVDSNIWFSAFYRQGKASELLEILPRKGYEVVVSQLVLSEVSVNVGRKLPEVLLRVGEYFEQSGVTVVRNPAVESMKKGVGLAHKKDVPILLSAVEYDCEYLVTGNLKDFEGGKIKRVYGLKVVGITEMMKEIKEDG